MFFNDRRNRPVESKRVGRVRSLITGAQVGSYTAPKNISLSSERPADYRVERYQNKRGNTFKNQPRTK